MKSLLRIAAALLVSAASLLAQPAQRHAVGDRGFSLEAPVSWKPGRAAGSIQLLMREYPSQNVVAILSVQLHPKSASLSSWATDYKSRQVPVIYPGARFTLDEETQILGRPAHRFQLVDLPATYEKYSAFETLIAFDNYFAFVSLHFDETRPRDYGPLYESILGSIETDEAAVPASSMSDLFDSRRIDYVPVDQIEWIESYPQAFEIARQRNVPVLIAFNRDQEPACQRFADRHYHDPEIVALSRRMVCLIASTFDHESAGNGQAECSRFGWVDCATHRDVDIRARQNLLEGTEVAIAPQHILCRPNGETLVRKEYEISKSALADLMREAIAVVSRDAQKAESDDFGERYSVANSREAKRTVLHDASLALDARDFRRLGESLVKQAKTPADALDLIDALAGTSHPDAAEIIERQLRHKVAEVRLLAARSLRQIASASSAKSLLTALRGEKKAAAACEMIHALGQCAPGDTRVAAALTRELTGPPLCRRLSAIVALRRFPDNSRVNKELRKLLGSTREDESILVAAAWTLGYLADVEARELITARLSTASAEVSEILRGALAKIEGSWQGDYEGLVRHFQQAMIAPR